MLTKVVIVDFALTGFRQENNIRIFLFEKRPMEGPITNYTVSVDLNLARRCGIPIQELGLACRRLLDQPDGDSPPKAVNFSEEQMNVYAKVWKVAQREALLARKVLPVSDAATAKVALTPNRSRATPREQA